MGPSINFREPCAYALYEPASRDIFRVTDLCTTAKLEHQSDHRWPMSPVEFFKQFQQHRAANSAPRGVALAPRISIHLAEDHRAKAQVEWESDKECHERAEG